MLVRNVDAALAQLPAVALAPCDRLGGFPADVVAHVVRDDVVVAEGELVGVVPGAFGLPSDGAVVVDPGGGGRGGEFGVGGDALEGPLDGLAAKLDAAVGGEVVTDSGRGGVSWGRGVGMGMGGCTSSFVGPRRSRPRCSERWTARGLGGVLLSPSWLAMRTGREGEDNKRHVEVCHGVESQSRRKAHPRGCRCQGDPTLTQERRKRHGMTGGRDRRPQQGPWGWHICELPRTAGGFGNMPRLFPRASPRRAVPR